MLSVKYKRMMLSVKYNRTDESIIDEAEVCGISDNRIDDFITTHRVGVFEWHSGESRPDIDLSAIIEIHADGDELEFIKNNFANLPMANHVRVVRWTGEHARFILGHL